MSDAEEKLSHDLGIDVVALETHALFAQDLSRMRLGEKGRLGYAFIDRSEGTGIVVVFRTPEEAERSLTDDPFVTDLCAEADATFRVVRNPVITELAGREIMLP